MEAISRTVTGEHSINTGTITEYTIDLAKNSGYPGGDIYADLLGYKDASVTIQSIGATGITGAFAIEQSNNRNVGFAMNPVASIASAVTGFAGAFDLSVTGRYLIINAGSIVWPTVGKIVIKIVGKR